MFGFSSLYLCIVLFLCLANPSLSLMRGIIPVLDIVNPSVFIFPVNGMTLLSIRTGSGFVFEIDRSWN